uniref:Uncharacterized protein n=1 Tax=Anguilla anguilla TaxID=7936 RepID=A0A0E9U1P9_ANGAN
MCLSGCILGKKEHFLYLRTSLCVLVLKDFFFQNYSGLASCLFLCYLVLSMTIINEMLQAPRICDVEHDPQ